MWMNEYEIEEWQVRYEGHEVLGPATCTLVSLMGWTNRNSDGWPYWQKPAKAADKLMDFIRGDDPQLYYDQERADATPAGFKAALRPLKAFRTRQGADFEIFETLADIVAADRRRAEAAETAERAELARLQAKYEGS